MLVFSKILEKSMYYRNYSFLCKHKLINTIQFGFSSKHPTENARISLKETITKYLDDGEIVCGVFKDLKITELEVNRIIGFDPFLQTGNNTCLWMFLFSDKNS